MSAASVSYILTAAKWAVENDVFLEDFVRRFPLPHAAIVTRGQYMTLGVPNLANPTLKPYAMVHSTQKVRKMLAQLVRLKEGKKKIATEHRIAIPETFRGYFEILSEDGRPIKCLESIMELCQKFPELCLVRQACKAYLPDGDGELRSLYRTRTVHEGEVLTLVGQFNLKRTVFLRCFDEQGASVYLKLNQKGKFSPVAQPDAITGVHSIENLMNKRLPLTVRLIHGDCPSQLTKVIGNGPLVLQLNSVFIDELAIICSLQREETLFHAVPLKAHIRLAPALNHQQLKTRAEFADVVDQCDSACTDILDRVVVYNDFVHSDTVGGGEEQTVSCPPPAPPVADEEIDQLYDYIRGLAPLPKDSKYHKSRSAPSKKHGFKPPPPPIETIPSRKSTHSGSSSSSKVQLQVEIRQHSSPTNVPAPNPPPPPPSSSAAAIIANPPVVGSVSKAAMRNSPPTNEQLVKGGNRSLSASVDRRSIDRSTVAGGRTAARSPPVSASAATATAAAVAASASAAAADRQRRLSQSTDKLAHSPPTRYRVSPPPSSDEEDPAWKNNAPGPAPRRRPLSMVLPDNVAFYAMQHPFGPLRPPMPPTLAFAPMYHPQQTMYQSMAAMPTSDGDKMAMGGAYGFPVLRSAVYPRYTPRYCHPPVMRHPMYRPV